MLEAAPPSDACSSLTRRKPRPSREASAARGGGGGRRKAEGHRASSAKRNGRDGRKTRGTHQTALLPCARWALPKVLPPAGERKFENVLGGLPVAGGTRGWLCFPLPLPTLLSALEGWSRPVSTPIALKSLENWLFAGESWRPQEWDPLPQQLLPLGQHHCHGGRPH